MARIEGDLGLPLLVINGPGCYEEPELRHQYEGVAILGQVFDRQERADDIISYMKEQVTLIEERTADIEESERPSVMYIGLRNDDGVGVVWGENFGDAKFSTKHANIKNVYEEPSRTSMSAEQIITLNPDVMILCTNSVRPNPDILASDPAYDNLEAAIAYDRSLKIKRDGKDRVSAMELTPHMNVLDIGSGPGILTIPLAGRVQRVTAVEPSEAMRMLLKKHMEERQFTNIRILPWLWEEVPEEELETYDLVIASYSLNMPDFRKAALKMNRHSRGEAVLYWFAGETSWETDVRILRERMGDTAPIKQHRKVDEFYWILYHEGIYCDVTMLQGTSFDREYETLEHAVRFGSYPMGLEELFDVIRTYVLDSDFPDSTLDTIVWKIRLPRVITAAMTGIALSTSGALFQGIFRNPLVEPYVLGVSSGSAFGAACCVGSGVETKRTGHGRSGI